ncbi:hypothetical protein MKEN_00663200 [Mycena kentingensis (nom. inval.)]|nr:hypothetical protein MKEN_00663200 [Mycena kentingensis (nom. inval.)]
MPATLFSGKAESKYNVTADFPSLGLHQAAATGNVGGVEFALARGQPVNSILDGVLPIHVASACGSEKVVRILVDRGADVNALRLPRRYSNEKNRNDVIIGASGSTPLHFAAANGHMAVVRTLLQLGALADRPDKHGVTPSMVAQQNNFPEIADELSAWSANRHKDLLERELPADEGEPESTRRRIGLKRSVDKQLYKGTSTEALKPPPPVLSSSSSSTPPPSPMRPFGEYTFYSNSPSPSPIDPGSRRPSLPQITYPAPPTVNRKASTASRGKSRRPRSAGNGAEPDVPAYGRGGAGRKLGSKYSLLGLFKKGQIEEDSEAASQTSAGVPSGSALSSSSSVALVDSSGPDGPSTFVRRPSTLSPPTQSQALPGAQKSPTRPPMAVDLHNAFAQHQHRERSGSNTSAPFEPTVFMAGESGGSPGSQSSFSRLNMLRPGHARDRSGSRGSNAGKAAEDDAAEGTSKAGRPGILRAHNRSISGPAPPPAVRSLRFDPTSDTASRRADSPARSLGLRGCTSAGSLSRARADSDRDLPESAPAAVSDFDLEALEKHFLEDDDEDEYAYGRPLPNSRLGIMANAARRTLSPPLPSVGLPFSIDDPPPIPYETESPGLASPDVRGRGASVSSTSTTDSQINPQMSASGTTSGSGSVAVMTPLQPTENLPLPTSPPPLQAQLEPEEQDNTISETLVSPKAGTGRSVERRTPTPLDINSLISSHAQAEALVKRELKDILDMPANSPDTSRTPGWTPLSARLAAYGESLELERKLRSETKITTPINEETPTALHPDTSERTQNNTFPRNGHGVGRQNSLDVKHGSPRKRPKQPRRPHTSSGTDTTSTESGVTHHSSRSTSAVSSTTDLRAVPMVAQTAATAAEVVEAAHRVRRARTPDPDAGLSRASSLEPESVDTELGPTLTRVSTAPMANPTKRDVARHIASANKLTRMGFQPTQAAKQPETPPGKRFGGLKSLMQTIKGAKS